MSDLESDKQVILASEAVQKRNIEACIEHANVSRQIAREAEDKVKHLEAQLLEMRQILDGYNVRIAMVQNQLGVGGTTQSDL